MKSWANACYLASIVSYILAFVGIHIMFYFLGCSLFLLGFYLSRKSKQ